MVIGAITVFSCATKFLNGRKRFFVVLLRRLRQRVAMLNACSAVSKKAWLSCAARLLFCKAFISKNQRNPCPVFGAGCENHYPGLPEAADGYVPNGRTGRRWTLGCN